MFKHCHKCDDYGEIVDPNAKCKCGMERILCPMCKGYSNPILAGKLIECKLQEIQSQPNVSQEKN